MHPSSYSMMQQMARAHLKPVARQQVLDVGGADVNGSYRPIFEKCRYITLDRTDADINVVGYDWPIADASFDIVISGQALEHDPFFWLTARNMARVTKPAGLLAIIVPSTGKEHRFPVDCYRFLPDSMQALAEIMEVDLLETLFNTESIWGDVGGVFLKPR